MKILKVASAADGRGAKSNRLTADNSVVENSFLPNDLVHH